MRGGGGCHGAGCDTRPPHHMFLMPWPTLSSTIQVYKMQLHNKTIETMWNAAHCQLTRIRCCMWQTIESNVMHSGNGRYQIGGNCTTAVWRAVGQEGCWRCDLGGVNRGRSSCSLPRCSLCALHLHGYPHLEALASRSSSQIEFDR